MEDVLQTQIVLPINSHTIQLVLPFVQLVVSQSMEDVLEVVQQVHFISVDSVMIHAQPKLDFIPTTLV
jgi:hypothetical protein